MSCMQVIIKLANFIFIKSLPRLRPLQSPEKEALLEIKNRHQNKRKNARKLKNAKITVKNV